MTPSKFKEIRECLGYNQKEFAVKLGYSDEHVNRWENDKKPIPDTIAEYVTLLKIMERWTSK